MSRVTSFPLHLLWLGVALAACSDHTDGIQPESTYAARCASPRSGIDPATNQAYPDVAGSVIDEEHWIRSWTNDLYLWYREVPDPDVKSFATALDYFDVMKTNATTASGKPKDQFHFTYTTTDWEALSQSGVEASYGLQWALLATKPPRELVVAFVEPGSRRPQRASIAARRSSRSTGSTSSTAPTSTP